MTFRHTEAGGYRWVTMPNDVYVGRSLEVYGEWSFAEVDILTRHLAPDANVVEVGSNIGAHTVPLARHLTAGRVFAFEPEPLIHQLLCANIVNNGCINVTSVQAAVGARAGMVRIENVMVDRPFNWGGVKVLDDAEAAADGKPVGPSSEVRLVTLDDALPEETVIAMIKCDAQGMELDVLKGAERRIKRDHPLLYLEDDQPALSAALFEAVQALDYEIWWHPVPLFRSDNVAGNTENIFGNTHSFNLLCGHKSRAMNIEDIPKLQTIREHPFLHNSKLREMYLKPQDR